MPVKRQWNLTAIPLLALFGLPVLLPTNHHGPYAWCDEPGEKAGGAKVQLTSEQANSLLDEVRSLRQDVKNLSELVEQRLAKTGAAPAEKPLEEAPRTILGTPEVLFFTATWCGPCQKMLPVVKELKREGFPIRIVDIDVEKQLASDFKIQAIPHLAIVSETLELDRIVGITNETGMKTLFEKHSIFRQDAEPEFKLAEMTGNLVHFQRIDPNSYSIAIDEVRVEGNSTVLESEIMKHVRVRPGLISTGKQIKDDVEALARTRWFVSIEPIIQRKEKEEENILIYRVVERPIVSRVEYKGLKKVQQKVLDKLTQLKPGRPFVVAANRECCRRIEEYYHEKGFLFATVKLEKGQDPNDREVVFLIKEGPKVHVTSTTPDGKNELNVALAESEPAVPEQQKSPEETRQPKAANRNPMLVESYVVADLLAPRGTVWRSADAPALRGALDLIDRVKDGIPPENWVENGGECTLIVNEPTLSFVIRASREMHDRLHARLEEIRRESGQSIQFETAILETADPEIYGRAGIKLSQQEETLKLKLVSDVEFDRLKSLIETDDKKILYIPKLTTSFGNIAQANWSASDPKVADEKLHLYMRGVLTADRKEIRLSVATNPDQLMRDFSTRQHRVGDGQWLLLDMSPAVKAESVDQPKGKVLVAIRPHLVKEDNEELASPTIEEPRQEK